MDIQVVSPLIRKFEHNIKLTDDARAALAGLPMYARQLGPSETVVREGDHPVTAILVVRGTLFRHKVVADGKRQILSFHITGDMPDLQSLFLQTMEHGLTSVERTEIVQIPHDALRKMMLDCPAAAKLLWRDTLIDSAIFREWIANTGRRRALPRTAHLLCELVTRATAVGLASNLACPLALTQNHFADALGLSTVHVNRSLQELRRSKLIELTQGQLKILDWDGLKAIGDFDPGYLYLDRPV